MRRAPLPALLLVLLASPLTGDALAQQEEGPLAFFEVVDATVATGRPVSVDARASRPSDGATNVTEFAWRWNATADYEPGNATTTHSYRQAGVHLVGLRVTDDAGRVAFANQSVLVVGSAPDANFYIEARERVDGGLRVVVNATFSEPSKGADRIVKYEWDWGEAGGGGFVEGNRTQEYFYETYGRYKISLRVTDDEGRSDTVNEFILIESTFLDRMLVVWAERDAFLRGAWLTLLLAVGTTIVGFAVALVLALMRISRFWLVRVPAATYIEIIRGTPLFLQILIAWLVLPSVGIDLGILYAGALALVVNTSAYQAEAIRGGIQAIPTGQMEAATSLGMTYFQAMRHVVVPQAFRLTLPPLGNEFIILLKDTSLLSVLGIFELTQVARILAANTFLVLESYMGVAVVYFVMTYSISVGLRYAERRLAIPGLGLHGSAA